MLGTFSFIQCEILQSLFIQTQCPCCVPHNYEAKQTNTHHEAKQTPISGSEIDSIPIVKTHIQSYRYCLPWVQRDPHRFKTCLQG